jgi:anaerobic magnesium-protoporphyrin IX monomethyl ester cyclase
MRIYFLNPPFLPGFVRGGRWQGVVARSKTMYYPLWLAYATALLESAGHECRLVDAPASGWDRERVLADAAAFRPDLAVLDSNFSSLSNDVETAGLLKERTGATTVLAGPPAATLTGRILDGDGVDIVARLEYDFTLAELARALADGKDPAGIAGISFTRDGKLVSTPDRPYTTDADLDRIPFVSEVYRRHLDVKAYWLGHTLHPVVQIFTGRGCPNQCTFCSWTETLTGRAYRVRSIKNVVDEFEYIVREMPEVREVFIEDDTFTIDKRRVKAFCDELTGRGLRIVWSCNARASLDYETMKLMKRAGCRLLDVGYESGSELILKNIRKGITREQMRQFARDARRAGLMVLGDFVFGFPGETKETAEETIAFAKELKPNYVQFAVATPMPGTAFYDYVSEHGNLLTDRLEESLDAGGFQKCIISYPDFTNGDIQHHVDRALRDYYLSPAYVVMGLRNILRRNGWHELKTMLSSAGVFIRYLGRKS